MALLLKFHRIKFTTPYVIITVHQEPLYALRQSQIVYHRNLISVEKYASQESYTYSGAASLEPDSSCMKFIAQNAIGIQLFVPQI